MTLTLEQLTILQAINSSSRKIPAAHFPAAQLRKLGKAGLVFFIRVNVGSVTLTPLGVRKARGES